MSELRAPDPTLTALPRGFVVEFIAADLHGEPAEAHRIDSQHASGSMVPAVDARWFAVPCRGCFPEAPPPGTDGPCCGNPEDCPRDGWYWAVNLKWQTRR